MLGLKCPHKTHRYTRVCTRTQMHHTFIGTTIHPQHKCTRPHTHSHRCTHTLTHAHIGPRAAGLGPFSSVSPMPGAGDAR